MRNQTALKHYNFKIALYYVTYLTKPMRMTMTDT